MKKLFSVMLMSMILLITSNTFAQKVVTLPLAAGDTAVNAGTSTKVLPSLSTGYGGAVIEVILTRNSGTAGGSLVVQGSLDGTNYTTIGSAVTPTNSASQSAMFYITEPVPAYLRTLLTGTGTMNVTQTVSYVYRKHN